MGACESCYFVLLLISCGSSSSTFSLLISSVDYHKTVEGNQKQVNTQPGAVWSSREKGRHLGIWGRGSQVGKEALPTSAQGRAANRSGGVQVSGDLVHEWGKKNQSGGLTGSERSVVMKTVWLQEKLSIYCSADVWTGAEWARPERKDEELQHLGGAQIRATWWSLAHPAGRRPPGDRTPQMDGGGLGQGPGVSGLPCYHCCCGRADEQE